MAIDTTEKLFSMLNFGDGCTSHLLFEVDGAGLNDDDQLHLLDLYSGIAASAAAAVVYAQWGMPFYFNSANWGSDAAFYLEVFFRSVIGTVYARLFDLTSSADVAGSELSSDNTSLRRMRTAALTLTDAHEYRLQLGKVNTTDQGEEEGADVVVIG